MVQQVHGEHRSQIAQAFILGNAFADPARLSDELFELSTHTLPPFLRQLPDRRAITLRPDAVYILATDGFWACAQPHLWISRWPALLARGNNARAMADLLFDEMTTRPPPALHIDNLTAIVLRPIADQEVADREHVGQRELGRQSEDVAEEPQLVGVDRDVCAAVGGGDPGSMGRCLR